MAAVSVQVRLGGAVQSIDVSTFIKSFFDVSKGRAKYSTIRDRIVSSARIDGIHACQLIAAMLIASIGLNINSTEAIIGAMLICPLMGSVLAMSLSIASTDGKLLRESLGGMATQCIICLVTSTLYFSISPLSTETSELLTNSSATIWDVLIALTGGFAGALGLSRRQEPSTLISGVAVATALMPPLCSTGYGIALRDGGMALSAFYEFLVNVVFIGFGATIVLVWLRIPLVADIDGDGRVTDEERAEVERYSQVLRRNLMIGLVIFAIPCIFFSMRTIRRSMAQNGTVFEVVDSYDTEMVTKELQIVLPDFVEYRVGVEDSYDEESDTVLQQVVATVVTARELDAEEQDDVRSIVALHVDDVDVVSFEVGEEITAS